MKDTHSADSNEKSIFGFLFFLSYGKFTKTSPTIKKKLLFRSVQIYREDANCSEKDFLVQEFFFWQFYFWYMVDFDVHDLMHARDWRLFAKYAVDAYQWG